MTLELANRAICTPAGIARDVFVPVRKFTFPADFVIVDYESDPRVPLILGRPFLRTARALIDVHREETILRDGDERLILNMRHDSSSYSNKPKKESINMIDIIQRISLTGFPAQSVGSSNTDVLDSPCLLVLITGTSQSRQHDKSESDSYYLSDLVINSFTGPKLISS
ncbi:reverse transcriptase domain-containing protein [Tanacetum coccineum]|uniref:Reverse transcriptase domain-containing protein n=1 Tax=Tanacetum coccineum TaxID=301880 RepID=A0ABQ4YJ01_9ASTR